MLRSMYLILAILEKGEAFNCIAAMTIKEIVSNDEDFPYKANTVYKTLNKMQESGWVEKGVSEGNAEAYYITDQGKRRMTSEE